MTTTTQSPIAALRDELARWPDRPYDWADPLIDAALEQARSEAGPGDSRALEALRMISQGDTVRLGEQYGESFRTVPTSKEIRRVAAAAVRHINGM